jgi:antigen flippase
MLKMLRGLLTLAPVTVLTIVTALVQTKTLAVLLGPRGMGFFFLAISFLNLATTVVALGASSSVVKLVSELGGAGRSIAILPSVGLALGVVTCTSLLLLVLLLVDPALFQRLFLGGAKLSGKDHRFILLLTALALVPTTWNLVLQAALKGLRSIGDYARAAALSTLFLMASIVGPAWIWGAHGALLGSIVGQLLSLLTFGVFTARVVRRRGIPRPARGVGTVDAGALGRRLITLGALALVAALASAAGQNVVRSYLASHFTLSAVAFFGAAWSLSNRLPLLVYQTFSTYVVPRISSFGEDWTKIRKEQNHALRLGFLATAPALALLIAMQSVVIPLLFSEKFLPMQTMLRTMLIGELLSVFFWVMSLALYPTGRATLNAVVEWSWWGLFIGGVILFAGRWGIEGVGWAYLGAYGLMGCVLYVWQYRRHAFRLTPDNQRLAIASVALLSLAASVTAVGGASPFARAAVLAAALLVWAAIVLSSSERAFAWRLISRGPTTSGRIG